MPLAGEVIRASDLGGADAWTDFTPTWTATVSNPAIGNGSLLGRYKQIGNTVHFVITITMGSTTTFGSGVYIFGLPVTAEGTTHPGAFGSLLIDVSPANRDGGVGSLNDADTFLIYADSTAAALVSNTHPWTWASGDIIRVSGTYEAA